MKLLAITFTFIIISLIPLTYPQVNGERRLHVVLMYESCSVTLLITIELTLFFDTIDQNMENHTLKN